MSEKTKRRYRVIPHIAYADDWSEIAKLDVTFDSFMARTDSLKQMLEKKGGFDNDKATTALAGFVSGRDAQARSQKGFDVVLETTEEVASWARMELAHLRQLESDARLDRDGRITRDKSESPVLAGNAQGRVELSDLAFTLLSAVEEPGEQLLMLLAELLNVDRHRQAIAEKNEPHLGLAAQIVAQVPDVTNADLAKAVGRDRATISRWRRKPEFERKVTFYKSLFSGEIEKRLRKLKKDA